VELGCIDIITDVMMSMLSTYLCMSREGHMDTMSMCLLTLRSITMKGTCACLCVDSDYAHDGEQFDAQGVQGDVLDL
jgi:hypothetical protein